MAIARIDEIQGPPTQGRFYLVPCVWVALYRPQMEWWPVDGPCHEDNEIIGFAKHHFHVDVRFLTKDQLCSIGDGLEGSAEERAHAVAVGARGGLPSDAATLIKVEWRRRRCRKALTRPAWQHQRPGSWPDKVKKHFAGQRCRHNAAGRLICPHRGADLSNRSAENGVIECPLHGLLIDAATGVVLPAPKRAEAA